MKRRFPILAFVLIGLFSVPAFAQTESANPTIAVVGAVNKPGIYQMQTTGLTLLQALAISGGLTPTANSSEAEVRRQVPGAAALKIPVDLKSILSGKQRDISLQPGDVILIPVSKPPKRLAPLADPPSTPPPKDIAKVEAVKP